MKRDHRFGHFGKTDRLKLIFKACLCLNSMAYDSLVLTQKSRYRRDERPLHTRRLDSVFIHKNINISLFGSL